jgi:hypothetical protein
MRVLTHGRRILGIRRAVISTMICIGLFHPTTMFRLMVTMRMLRAATVSVLSIFPFNRIPVPSITVSELVVKEPSRDPIWAVFSRTGEVPVIAGTSVARLSNTSHGFVLGLLDNIAPVVRWIPLAVLL